MGSGDVAQCIDYGQNDQAKGKRYSAVRDGPARHVVDDDGPGSSEDERERAD